jgi:hypothetical protein
MPVPRKPHDTLAELKKTRQSVRVGGELMNPPMAEPQGTFSLPYQHPSQDDALLTSVLKDLDWVAVGGCVITLGVLGWMIYGAVRLFEASLK